MMIIQKVQIAEADTLLAFSKKTFYDFFAHLNEPEHMDTYSAIAFTTQSILEQLTNPNSEFYFAVDEGNIIGYIKLNFNNAQTEFQYSPALEVERIYVLADQHGKHIGKAMLDFAIGIGSNRCLDYVWLGVWEHNHKAIGFYEHNGFEIFGSHEFLLGNDRQTDLLMRKAIV